jgi:hypothetical protein
MNKRYLGLIMAGLGVGSISAADKTPETKVQNVSGAYYQSAYTHKKTIYIDKNTYVWAIGSQYKIIENNTEESKESIWNTIK